MKNPFRTLLLGAALVVTALPAQAIDADQVMARNFRATKVSAFTGEVTMSLVNSRDEKRVRRMSVQSRLRENGVDSAVMTRFAQPADIKGTGFLQVENSAADDDIWVYLPALGKTRRLASNNKRDSFFGTDFSYGDILLPPVEKWEHTLLRQETVDGAPCHVVESRPRDARTRDDIGYARRISWIDATTFVERKVDYYDTRGQLLKTQLTFDVKPEEPGRFMPMRRQMTNHQTGHQTLYQFERFSVDKALKDGDFSVRRLEAR
jgi:hypothetical protein